MHKEHHSMHEKLLKTIQKCTATCEKMTVMVPMMPDFPMRVNQLRLLNDCADICDTTEDFVARHSPFTKPLLTLCADICETCGTECSRFPDAESQKCAKTCLHCAHECRKHAMM